MELEITIRVPLGAQGVSVQQRRLDGDAAGVSPDAVPPPPVEVVDALAARGAETAAAGGDGGLATDLGATDAHQPPSPGDAGFPVPRAPSEAAPPTIEMIRRAATDSAPAAGPPGLEDAVPGGPPAAHGPPAVPPELPDPSEAPAVDEEFAPPPVEAEA